MGGSWLLAALLVGGTGRESKMNQQRIDEFKARVGFASLAAITGADGVAADWTELPRRLAPHIAGKRVDAMQIVPMAPGLAKTEMVWREGARQVDVSVFVSGTGPGAAHDQLLSLASATMMMKIPYQPGPEGLGDLSVRHLVPPGDRLMWVYRNVCVLIDNEGSGVDLEPVARTVQQFMRSHWVARLAPHLPALERIDVSPKQAHVGDEIRVAVTLAKTTPAASVETRIADVGEPAREGSTYRLEVLSSQPLAAVYKAREPGRARVDVSVIDRKTLLSPPASINIDILAAR